jgi:hypothetical protein
MEKETISGILKQFMKAISNIFLSKLKCECYFSAMSMTVKQKTLPVANLLFINSGGPPISQFDPTKNIR